MKGANVRGIRAIRKGNAENKLVEAWLALTSVNFYRNVQVSILLDQWLAQPAPER